MKVFFDTSVIVSALVDQLPRHDAAFECYRAFTRAPHRAVTTTHALAEIYATLTALPLRQRILPGEAKQLIDKSVRSKLRLVVLSTEDYTKALERVADLGLLSGIVYDALHLVAAENDGCRRLYSFNLRHFERLEPAGLSVACP